jgi:hypothetical protein
MYVIVRNSLVGGWTIRFKVVACGKAFVNSVRITQV